MKSIDTTKLIAAFWFATTGFIPAIAVFLLFSEYTFGSYLIFLAAPVVIAGICGYFVGSVITQGEKVQNELQAALRGMYVAIVAYLGLGLIFIIAEIPISLINYATAGLYMVLISTVSIIVGFLILFPIFFYGQFILLLATGACAGWLLFKMFKNGTQFKRLAPLLAGGVLILMAGVYFLWSLPNPNNIPIYPRAENVESGDFETTDSGTAKEKTITFQTDDPGAMVLDYYTQELVNEGWADPSMLYGGVLTVHNLTKNYKVDVDANDENGRTQVKIRVWHPSFP